MGRYDFSRSYHMTTPWIFLLFSEVFFVSETDVETSHKYIFVRSRDKFKYYISTTIRPITTKHGIVVTQGEWFSLPKSHVPLITR